MNEKITVLLSGGLDSAITTAYLQEQGHAVAGCVFIDRGQTNLSRESAAAGYVAHHLGIAKLYRASFALSDFNAMLNDDMRKRLGIPGRNLILATLALPYLAVSDSSVLVLGNIATDTLPDNSSQFRTALSSIASQVLERQVVVIAPFADWEWWNKADEIRFAQEHGYGKLFDLTWTCWGGDPFPCGECGACRKRLRAFAEAGIEDPAPYRRRGS